MEKGNVLIIGNSGVGKSTLINAVLGEERVVTGFGTAGTTKELSINEHPDVPFRLIDTVGFEPSFLKERAAIQAVKKWSKDSVKTGNEDTRIHVIWFCVEGTSSKLFPKAIQNLSRATSMWPSVPVIVVITKSYSVPDRSRNIEMVHNAFAMQKRYAKNLRHVIPVVATPYVLNDHAFAPPEGITDLIDATNELLPEGIQAAGTDIASFKLTRKRALAHGTVGVATTAAVVVGAVPIPFSDALILGPIELGEINALAQIYGLGKNEESKRFMNSIVEVGTVGVAAKTAINALKAIPGLNIGASVLNAVIAGSIVAALGEGSIFAFEQVYLGKKSTADIDWVKKVIESKFSSQFVGKVTQAIGRISEKSDDKSIVQVILELFNPPKS
ncbi:MAG: GTP-binding protein [Chloroflexi bacterium]|nr:GTP-binding protein [Chloroflexota bacterium]